MYPIGTILMISACIGLAVVYRKLESKSPRLKWMLFSALILPAAIFIAARLTVGANPKSIFGSIASGTFTIAIIGLVFSKYAEAISFEEHPIAFILFGIAVLMLSILAVVTAAVNLGLMEP